VHISGHRGKYPDHQQRGLQDTVRSTGRIINRNYSVLLHSLRSDELTNIVKNIRVRDFRGIERELRVPIGDRVRLLRIFITPLGMRAIFWGHWLFLMNLTEIARAERRWPGRRWPGGSAHEIKNPLTPIQLSTEHMIKKWQSRTRTSQDFRPLHKGDYQRGGKPEESRERFFTVRQDAEIRKTPVSIQPSPARSLSCYKDI